MKGPLGNAVESVRNPSPERVVAAINAMRSPQGRLRTPITEALVELVRCVEASRPMEQDEYEDTVHYAIRHAADRIMMAVTTEGDDGD